MCNMAKTEQKRWHFNEQMHDDNDQRDGDDDDDSNVLAQNCLRNGTK